MGTETTCDAPRRASWLYRLNHTPLRDVLRGQLTGRMDVNAIVTAAELPEPLADLVRRVVRRTRLSRLEKADVARELIAHFEDGLAASLAAEELVGSFGAVKQAARLIRRAKLRSRSAAGKFAHLALRLVQGLLLVFLAVYGVQAIRMYGGSVKITHDYVAEWNAEALRVPESERAWPIYRDAALKTAEWPRFTSSDLKPGGNKWPEAKAFAAEHAEVIRLYRQAASMAKLGAVLNDERDAGLEQRTRRPRRVQGDGGAKPPDEKPMFIAVTLPQLGVLREARRLLTIDAHTAAEQGDRDDAYADVNAMIGLPDHATQLRFLTADLLAVALVRRAADVVGAILRDHPDLFSDTQLVQLLHRFASLGGGVLRVSLRSEYATVEDAVQRLYTDDGHGDGVLQPEMSGFLSSLSASSGVTGWAAKVVMPALSTVVAGRRETLGQYHELMGRYEAEGDLPLWQHDRSQADLETERWTGAFGNRLRYPIIAIMMPKFSEAFRCVEYTTQQRDATLVALALELHRRRTGDWPMSLEELTPQLLPAVPPDRYDGKPLKYRIVDGQPVLYSVGVDRDDDGGRVPEHGNVHAQRWQPPSAIEELKAAGSPHLPDGDWVLWPPVE